MRVNIASYNKDTDELIQVEGVGDSVEECIEKAIEDYEEQQRVNGEGAE